MKRIKLSKNLWLDEYIPKPLYERPYHTGDRFYKAGDAFYRILIRKLNKELILSDQLLRDKFGPVTLNDWWNGGRFNYRGFRTSGCGVGSELSDHFQGNASDKDFRDATAEEVRDYIKENYQDLGITIIEEGVNWVHTSVAWVKRKELLLIYP